MDKILYFDLIILLLICLLSFKGLMNGLIKELLGLVGIIGGFFVASHSATSVSKIIELFLPIENTYLRLLLGFILAFISFLFVVYIISLIIRKLFTLSGLGIFDIVGGFVFGFLKAFLIFGVIVYFITKIEFLNDRINKAMTNSFMYPLLKDSGYFIMTSKDIQLQNKIDSAISGIQKDINQKSTQIITQEAGKQIQEISKNIGDSIKKQVDEYSIDEQADKNPFKQKLTPNEKKEDNN